MKIKGHVRLAIISVIISMGLISCEEVDNNNAQQKIYFEHYASNYSWKFSHVHWIIDNEGNVRTNRKKDSIISINVNELDQYIYNFDTIIYKVTESELNHYVNLIEAASKGTIDSTSRSRRDFGETVFNCFGFDKTQNRFNLILLSKMSDNLDKANTDSSAVKIDKWLKNIHLEIYSGK